MAKATRVPFQRLDGLVLILFFVVGLYAAVLIDAEFMENLWYFDAGNPWAFLPDCVAALELPAKRVQFDFLAFLSVVTPGIGLVTFRRLASWRWGGFPGPGVAASATSALTELHQVAERICLLYYNHPGYRKLGLIWPPGGRIQWSPYDWGYASSLFQIGSGVTGAILGVWAYLILARAWKARDDWRDFLGRWLAWCWLGEVAFSTLAPVIWG
jgi:hypothetical protein